MPRNKKAALVSQHLENISGDALARYEAIIRVYVRGKHGIYALYRRGKLYYVGLATNLRNRLRSHVKDRHAGLWDRFSVYLTVQTQHIKELESLLLRIVKPDGNRQSGKFAKSENLRSRLQRDVWTYLRRQTADLFGRRVRVRSFRRAKGAEQLPLAGVFNKAVALRKRYKGKLYRATLRRDGRIGHLGKVYESPSDAASAVRKRPTNGWTFWQYQRRRGEWVKLQELRR